MSARLQAPDRLPVTAVTFGVGALMVAGWGHILAGPLTPKRS